MRPITVTPKRIITTDDTGFMKPAPDPLGDLYGDEIAQLRLERQKKESELAATKARADDLGGINGALFGGAAGLFAGLARTPAIADQALDARSEPIKTRIKALEADTATVDNNLLKLNMGQKEMRAKQAQGKIDRNEKLQDTLTAEQFKWDLAHGGKGGIRPITEGEKALDKDFAKTQNDWISSGSSTVEKNLKRLEDAKAALASDSSLTGGIRGMFPDVVRNLTNEKAITTRDDTRAAAQGALKATLGAQFTEKEGERIMNQAYNERLSPQANMTKIQAAIDELTRNKLANDSRAQYFQQHGTLKGWTSDGPALAVALPARQQSVASVPPPETPAAPAPGTIMAGHIFKGGDPADQANWQPITNVRGTAKR